MNILYVITMPERGGAQVHVADLIRRLAPNHEITLATSQTADTFLIDEALRAGARVRVLKHLQRPIVPLDEPKAYVEIRDLVKELQPDLVHGHSTKAGILARMAASAEGVPGLVTVHGWSFSDGFSRKMQVLGKLAERWTARKGQPIIVVADAQKRLGLDANVAPEEQLHVIHNGIADHDARATPGAERDVMEVVMVARFQEPKNHADPLRVLAQSDAGLHVTFVGDGAKEEAMHTFARSSGVQDRVTFAGYSSDVIPFLTRAQVFMLISDSEGFPLSILEGMRAGLPVVASDVGGIGEAVVEGETGFLVPAGDVDLLRKRLEQLAADPALRKRMGEAGRARFEQLFTLDAMIERTLDVYEVATKGTLVRPSV
ncbi:MAG: glycosyltransferase family 4 protein [Bacteroidota bacterium]